jgi:Zn-dependent protease with chaperone function
MSNERSGDLKPGRKERFATNKGIVFTRGLLDSLDKDEIMSVAAHELGHIKGKHATYKFIATMGMIAAIMFEWLRFTYPILLNETITQIVLQTTLDIAALAFLFVAMIPLNWVAELKADKAAVKFEGKENMQSALLKLTKPEELDQPNETHPSTKQRIEHIQKMKT